MHFIIAWVDVLLAISAGYISRCFSLGVTVESASVKLSDSNFIQITEESNSLVRFIYHSPALTHNTFNSPALADRQRV